MSDLKNLRESTRVHGRFRDTLDKQPLCDALNQVELQMYILRVGRAKRMCSLSLSLARCN